MSQVGSPPGTARPAPTAPAVTGAAVTPTPTDQATGNAPRHQGGGQPAPQHQPPPQAPAPPAPAVTLAGALTALFSGQPARATVEAAANGQLILRLPEAQLVIAAEAIEAARGDVLVLKLAASSPNPAIIVTSRNGRPVADAASVPVIIEPVPAQAAALTPPLPRRPTPPVALPPLPNIVTSPVQVAARPPAPLPAAARASAEPVPAQPQVLPVRIPAAAPSPPAAPPVLIEAELPPLSGEAVVPDIAPAPLRPPPHQNVAQPVRPIAPGPFAVPAPPAQPSPTLVSAKPPPLPVRDPLMPPAPIQAQAEPVAPVPARPPIAVPTRVEGEAATARPPPRELNQPASLAVVPLPPRRNAERPIPFVPPAIPPEAWRPPISQPTVAIRAALPPNPALPNPVLPNSAAGPFPARPQPEAAKLAAENRPAAATPAAPAKAPAIPTAPTAPAELVPIEVEPMPPPDAPIDRRAASAWAALWATARLDPVVAERIRDMLQPKAGGRLGGGLAFLVSALRGGKLADWLGTDDSVRIDRPSRPSGMRTVEAEFRDLARMAQERGPDGWRASPLAVLDGGAVQPVMLYIHRPPRRRKNDPRPGDSSERFMLDLKLSRAGPMRIDGLLRPKALDVIVRTERSVPSRIQRELRQVFTTSLEGAGLGGTLAFQTVDRLPPPPSMAADSKPHHAVLA